MKRFEFFKTLLGMLLATIFGSATAKANRSNSLTDTNILDIIDFYQIVTVPCFGPTEKDPERKIKMMVYSGTREYFRVGYGTDVRSAVINYLLQKPEWWAKGQS